MRRFVIQFDPKKLIPLLMSQCNDRIHFRSSCGWIQSEDDADTGTDEKGQHNAPGGNDGRHAYNIGYQ